MRQQVAIQVLTEALREDDAVEAIFLKGSFGRGEGDEHSDVDLYVLVAEGDVDSFLTRRHDHLATYRPILLTDEIHIIAPQLIVVYDDFLHVDLFTVTIETLTNQDEVTVLYDPKARLKSHRSTLTLSDDALFNHAFDAIWFFFQYTKARDRGNDIWATEMLRQGMSHFAYVLAAHYDSARSTLGLKDVAARGVLPLSEWYERLTPSQHASAATEYVRRLEAEEAFLTSIVGFERIETFYRQLLHREKSRLV
ncbi:MULTISPECIES: nucleotidyltransferase domain-containing protein [Exiguobacterium]|uniref:nucleotidyltransferase domain-containing protein n=1 Tax=Exiguobacterium TaxID=33986 RepID=UPI001BEB7E14|nr:MULTISPECIES: nucleotidyltransferase domain-containing protein [Exiguobacterium]MCT4784608.1 nucleotidyltransferase domain-containing protein [Exiguobacterium himgiriensis]